MQLKWVAVAILLIGVVLKILSAIIDIIVVIDKLRKMQQSKRRHQAKVKECKNIVDRAIKNILSI